MLDASVLDRSLLEPSVTRRDSWRGSDTTQEIEFNKININCRVHDESEERRVSMPRRPLSSARFALVEYSSARIG